MYVESGSSNDAPELSEKYYQQWLEEQEELLHALQGAVKSNAKEDEIKTMVETVQRHFEDYYDAKQGAAKHDVLNIVHPKWKSPLENAFMFIGGWRPSMAFQLVYALTGNKMEGELNNILEGLNTPSVASLRASQLQELNIMQVETRQKEDELEHRMAHLQQGIADQPLLNIVEMEAILENSDHKEREETMDEKVKLLENIVVETDNLRLDTLRKVLQFLTPVQSAEYLIAAAQMHKAIRKSGEKRVEEQQNEHIQKQEEAKEGPSESSS